MADGTSVTKIEMATCPACGRKIEATITYAVVLGERSFGNEVVTASMRPTGITVRHECVDGRVVPQVRKAVR